MFKIYDGREQFYQWDLNRKLIIEDATISQVHFCNKTDDCSLVCDVYEEDGLRLVDVPNILLQETWRINVYAYDKNYTKHCDKFNVAARSKPADYVYTETEVHTWTELEERVTYLEENGTGGTSAPVTECNCIYVGTEEPTDDSLVWINPDGAATEYATKAYVDDAIANIDIPESSGSMQVFVFEHYTLATLTDEEKEMAVYLYKTVKNTGKAPADCIFYFKANNYDYILNQINFDSNNRLYINIRENASTVYQYVILADDAGTCTEFIRYQQYTEICSVKDWTKTTSANDSDLYNAKEILVVAYEFTNDYIMTSYVVFDDFLGAYSSAYKYMFTTPEGMDNQTPYWQYDGAGIVIASNSNNYSYEIKWIAYK